MAPIRTNKAIVAAAASGAAVTLFGCNDAGSKQADQCGNYSVENDNLEECPDVCVKQENDECIVASEAPFTKEECEDNFGTDAWIDEPEQCIHECQLKTAGPVPDATTFPVDTNASSAIWKSVSGEYDCVGVITVNAADDATYDAASTGAGCEMGALSQEALEDNAVAIKFFDAAALPEVGSAVAADWQVEVVDESDNTTSIVDCTGAITRNEDGENGEITYSVASATEGCTNAELSIFDLVQSDLQVFSCGEGCLVDYQAEIGCKAAVEADQEACAAAAAEGEDACGAADFCDYTAAVFNCSVSREDIQCSFKGDDCKWTQDELSHLESEDAQCLQECQWYDIEEITETGDDFQDVLPSNDLTEDEEQGQAVAATWNVQVDDDEDVLCIGAIVEHIVPDLDTAAADATSSTYDLFSATNAACNKSEQDVADLKAMDIKFYDSSKTNACGAAAGCSVVENDGENKEAHPLLCLADDSDLTDACAEVEDADKDKCAAASCSFYAGAQDDNLATFCDAPKAGCFNPTVDEECTIAEFDTEDKCNGEAGCNWEPAACEINWPTEATEYEALCEALAGTYFEAQSAKCENPIIAVCAAIIDDAEACAAQDGCELSDDETPVCVHSDITEDPCDVDLSDAAAVCPEECVSTEAAEQHCELMWIGATDPCTNQVDECTFMVNDEDICMEKADECVGEYQKPVDPFAEDEE